MQEKSVIECKVCKLLKERFLAGMFNMHDKKWVDINGRLFNGKTCPDCHAVKMRDRMRAKKDAEKSTQEN